MAIRPLMASKESQKRDPIMAEGLLIRRRSIALFLANGLAIIPALFFDKIYIYIPVIAFMMGTYIYSRKFRAWELANKDYLRKMGFCVYD